MRNCPHHISAWLSESDYRHLKKLMDASGLTASNIIRKLLEGVEVTPRPTEHTVALLRELSAIGNNINQIAHTANATRSVSAAQVDEIRRLLDEAWRMVKDAY